MISCYENENVSLYLSNLHVISQQKTTKQSVELFEHEQLGKVLVIDDEIQHVERWAPLYHESIVHIPMMFLSAPETALILGGGDLYAAYELLKYPSLKRIVICDHDPEVINLTHKYYIHGTKVCESTRVEFVFMDVFDYLNSCGEQFDIIINDCFNSAVVYEKRPHILTQISNSLSRQGVCSDLVYRHLFDAPTLQKTRSQLAPIANKAFSLVYVPEYPGILHLLAMWGKSEMISQQVTQSSNLYHTAEEFHKLKCQLFDPRFCTFYLFLPPYIAKELEV